MQSITEPTTGVTTKCEVEADLSNPNRPMFLIKNFDENDVEIGTPIRIWLQDGRLTYNLAGVNGTYFHLEPGTDHIQLTP